MKMLRKQFGFDIKDVSSEGLIEGYGSVFGGDPDSYGDIVMPGAFVDSLAQHRRQKTMPLMLWGHQAGELPIGDWTDMVEDGKGLRVQGKIDLADPVGARVHRAMQRKSVRGLSIGYETLDAETDPKRPGVTFLKQLDLWEVSPVNFPANRRAQLTSVKSIIEGGELPTVRQFEDFLRDAGGFSKSLAAAIAAKATPHLRGEPEAKADDAAWTRFFERLGA
jgi:uncharacterized protein